MQFEDVVSRRYSCRSFLDRQVPRRAVERIVALAQRMPSWGNTQPWKVYAAGGRTAEDIRADLKKAFRNHEVSLPDFQMPIGFEDLMMERYRNVGRALFKTLGIPRESKQRRAAHYLSNYDAFGAATLLFVTAPLGQSDYVLYDTGAFVAGLCLAAASLQLATCLLAPLARHPKLVRRHLDIPAEEGLVIGVALGYADENAPANSFRSERVALEEVLTCRGLE